MLKEFKADHETRIRMLTEAKADKQTAPLVLRATIGTSPVVVPAADMQAAVSPFYLNPLDVDIFDLTAGDEARTDAYWRAGADTIRERVRRFYERLRNEDRTSVSVFALAPIPYSVVLGSALSNKYPTTLFQRHRDTEDWQWKENGVPVDFEYRMRQQGTDPVRVTLVLSVSGSVPPADYAGVVDDTFTVYEIVPEGAEPSFDILRLRGSLEAFRARYRAALQQIVATHPSAAEVHVVPALPAPAAVAVGLDWMRKTHPALVVYDKQATAGFERTIKIDDGEVTRSSEWRIHC